MTPLSADYLQSCIHQCLELSADRLLSWLDSLLSDGVPAEGLPIPENGAAAERDATNPVLVLADDPYWWLLGCLHGALHRQAVLPWTEAALGELAAMKNLKTVTVVGSPQTLDHALLRQVMELTRRKDVPAMQTRVPWGVLTARSPEAAFQLIVRSARARLAPPPPRRVLVSRADELTVDPQALPEDLIVLNRLNTTVETIRQVLAEPADLVSILAHGRDDSLWVEGGLICGRADGAPGARSLRFGGLPSCAHGGNCFVPSRRLMDAAELTATVVFINSCSALKINSSIFPTDYNVGLRILDGQACAVLASPFMTDGKIWQNLLFHFLAGSGEPLGRSLAVVNNATVLSGLDFPGIVLIGDPLLRLQPCPQPRASAVWQDGVFRVMGAHTHFVRTALPGGGAEQLFVAPEGEHLTAKEPVYYAVDRGEDEVQLYLFSLAPLPKALSVAVRPGDAMVPLRTVATEVYGGLQGLECFGIRHQKLERLTAELKNMLRSQWAVAGSSGYCLQSAETAMRRTQRFLALRERIQETVLEWLLDATHRQGLQLYEAYKPGFRAADWDWGRENCAYCQQPLVWFRVTAYLAEGTERMVRLCPTCGIVHDGDGRLELYLQGPGTVAGTEPAVMQLVVANKSDRPLSGVVGGAVINGDMYGFIPVGNRYRFDLPGGAQASFPITVKASGKTSPHHFWLRGYAVSGGNVYAASANFWVTPSCTDT